MSAEELPVIQPAEPTSTGAARPDGDTQDLTLVSVSRDGKRMLFVDDSGREFTVEVDERLRAALPADSRRRQETPMSNPMRPKDIQTRIRAGESVDDVAAAGGTTVEKIMPFAAPVLAEREHMAERAQKGSVRRRPGEPAGTARTLGAAVAGRLGAFYVDPDAVTWDSFRRPDGRWALRGEFTTPERTGTAEFAFDVAGNYVAAENDHARWLVGEQLEMSEPAPLRDDLMVARQRRAAVPPIDVPEPEPEAVASEVEVDQPLEAFLEPEQVEAPEPAPAPVAEKPRSSRRKRASVPSWDEIMFGGKAD